MHPVDNENLGQDKLLTCRQAAELTGLSERSMRGLFDSRTIDLVKLGRRLYVLESALSRFIKANTLPSAKEMDQ